MPLPIYLQVKPVPTILPKYFGGAGFQLCYDGEFWWIDQQAYELTTWSWWPWWYLGLRCTLTGRRRHLRVFQRQLSERDHWQLTLLFRLYRL